MHVDLVQHLKGIWNMNCYEELRVKSFSEVMYDWFTEGYRAVKFL